MFACNTRDIQSDQNPPIPLEIGGHQNGITLGHG